MWYGGPYDPDDIDEKQICAAFRRLASASVPAAAAAEKQTTPATAPISWSLTDDVSRPPETPS
jgi:hypothetical protein